MFFWPVIDMDKWCVHMCGATLHIAFLPPFFSHELCSWTSFSCHHLQVVEELMGRGGVAYETAFFFFVIFGALTGI